MIENKRQTLSRGLRILQKNSYYPEEFFESSKIEHRIDEKFIVHINVRLHLKDSDDERLCLFKSSVLQLSCSCSQLPIISHSKLARFDHDTGIDMR